MPTTSLIVTTYNRPQALKLVLASIQSQIEIPSEVIIADDGSDSETGKLITSFQQCFPYPLIHCWQEDKGFRAARIRNIALAKSQGDLIILIDGDMVLTPHFISDHQKFCQSRTYIQGSRALLSSELTQNLLNNNSLKLNPWSEGIKNRQNAIRIPFLANLYQYFGQNNLLTGTRSANLSLWRSDILTINGFNNKFEGWGREDSEFVVRLLNSGIKRKNLKFAAIGYHLWHPDNPRQNLPENEQILSDTIANKQTRCEDGLNRFIDN